jgi:hypothetical protein
VAELEATVEGQIVPDLLIPISHAAPGLPITVDPDIIFALSNSLDEWMCPCKDGCPDCENSS